MVDMATSTKATIFERCRALLCGFDESQLADAADYLERLREEKDDMDFCVRLWDEASATNDSTLLSAEDVARRYGI
jgi:hypothetical protein